MSSLTLYDKLWRDHLVCQESNGDSLIYIDRHLVHEVTSPQAFEGLALAARPLWRKNSIIAVPDHNVPTEHRKDGIRDPISRIQVDTLTHNCKENALAYYDLNDVRQGIVHVIGPEQGLTLPGMTVVCGDSHTSTHGALATLAMGIGTSEVEHVFASQCLVMKKLSNMRIHINGVLPKFVTAKDVILAIIGKIGTAGGTGYAIEYAGNVIREFSIEQRMTVCNMTIEAGARAGMVAFDATTAAYLKGRTHAPKGAMWEAALEAFSDMHSDEEATFDHEISLQAEDIAPQVSWGTSPEMVMPVTGVVPSPEQANDQSKADSWRTALSYMGLEAGTPIQDITLDKIFIGSCTNSRIEDLRAAAKVIEGKKVSKHIRQAMVVPGSGIVKQQAESEGLDQIFTTAGFEWREPGCSMCLAMNADRLESGERCASTSNRNFEGRQGQGGRTHLVSPEMAAAAAIEGHFVDIRKWAIS